MRGKLLLVRPKLDYLRKGRFNSVSSRPPMNLFYIGAFLEERGHSVEVVDYEFERFSPEIFRKKLAEFRPDFVGVGIGSSSEMSSAELCGIAKGLGIPSIAGGAYATTCPERVMDVTGADYCIVGEAEGLLDGLLSSSGPKGKGIFREAVLPKNLDRFGFPDRSRAEFQKYSSCFSAGIPKKTAFITASRGCPYSCTFCISPVIHGKSWRARSVDSVISEIENCVSAGYRHVQFDDDIFGLSRKWFLDFCGNMRKTGLAGKVSWDFSTRADLFDDDLALAAKSSGCVKVCIGVESGSRRILSGLRKGITPGTVRRAFSLAKESGLMTEMFLIVGNIGETRKDLEATEKLLFEIDPDLPVINVFSPLPGTAEHVRAVKGGFLRGAAEPLRGFFSNEYSLSGQHLSGKEVISFRDSLCRKFYLRPSYIFRRAAAIRSFGDLEYNLGAALSVLGLR
ncbi:MAG: radical SAM protein [archaeon]